MTATRKAKTKSSRTSKRSLKDSGLHRMTKQKITLPTGGFLYLLKPGVAHGARIETGDRRPKNQLDYGVEWFQKVKTVK